MRWFKRGSGEPDRPVDFWTWWSGARDRVARGIETGGVDPGLVREISAAVQSIERSMGWELAPGSSARHAFCISPEGNAALRQVAIRWLASAPPADSTWEFHASKQASPTPHGLEVGGRRLDLGEMRAERTWDAARRRIDVGLWHQAFASLPEKARLQAAFIFLDQLLGEDDVERWVGQIDVLDRAPAEALGPAELKAEIDRHRAEPGGAETWTLATAARPDGSPAVVLANTGLKRIDHPFADVHVTIAVLYGAERMPTDAEATILNDEEDDLLRRLGDVATFAGRATVWGSRTLHFVAEDPERMKPAIDAWALALPDALSPDLPPRRIKVNFERDMDWSFQRDFGVR